MKPLVLQHRLRCTRTAAYRRPVRGTNLPLPIFLDEYLSNPGEVMVHRSSAFRSQRAFRIKVRHRCLTLDEGDHANVLGVEVERVELARSIIGRDFLQQPPA